MRGIDFEVDRGETFGFLGPNGAGKSTTITMLCTLVRADRRQRARRRARRRPRARRGAPQHRPRLPGHDARRLPHRRAEPAPARRALRRAARADRGRACEQVLEMVGLWERRDSLVATFSGGMKRRLEIARGLLHSPRVLFLDEPTVGLDPQTRSSIWSYIRELKRRARTSRSSSPPTTWTRPSTATASRSWTRARSSSLDTPEALKAAVGTDRVQIADRRRRGARSRALRERFGDRGDGSPRARSPSASRRASSSCRACSPSSACRSARSASRGPSLDDVFMSYTGTTIRDAEADDGRPAARDRARMRGGADDGRRTARAATGRSARQLARASTCRPAAGAASCARSRSSGSAS